MSWQTAKVSVVSVHNKHDLRHPDGRWRRGDTQPSDATLDAPREARFGADLTEVVRMNVAHLRHHFGDCGDSDEALAVAVHAAERSFGSQRSQLQDMRAAMNPDDSPYDNARSALRGTPPAQRTSDLISAACVAAVSV